MQQNPEPQPPTPIKSRLLFHSAGYALTMLAAIPALFLGITREDWDRDTRITFGIGGAGIALGSTLVFAAICLRLWKERREKARP